MNAAYLQEKFNEGKSQGLSDDLAAVYQSGFATSWSETFGKVGTWQGIAPVGSAVYMKCSLKPQILVKVSPIRTQLITSSAPLPRPVQMPMVSLPTQTALKLKNLPI